MDGLTTPIDIKYFSNEIFITSIGKVNDRILMYLCITMQTDSSIPADKNRSRKNNEDIRRLVHDNAIYGVIPI
jgi:hypothetical protein